MIDTEASANLSHHIWSSLSLELYLCRREEYAVEAMFKAIKIAEQLNEDKSSALGTLYGDLSMYYEADKNYGKALEAMKMSYENRRSSYGEDHILTRLDEEDVNRLEHFQSFRKDEKLQKELNDWFRSGIQSD